MRNDDGNEGKADMKDESQVNAATDAGGSSSTVPTMENYARSLAHAASGEEMTLIVTFFLEGDEYAFFYTAKNIADGLPFNLFSQEGVYGVHPVLSSAYQAIFIKLSAGDLFAWAEGCGPLRRNDRAVETRLREGLGPLDVVLVSSTAEGDPGGTLACVAPARYRTDPDVCDNPESGAFRNAGDSEAGNFDLPTATWMPSPATTALMVARPPAGWGRGSSTGRQADGPKSTADGAGGAVVPPAASGSSMNSAGAWNSSAGAVVQSSSYVDLTKPS